MNNCPTCAWLNQLEAERFMKPAKPQPQPQALTALPEVRVITKTVKVKVADEVRDRDFFNAGRYAAGARDSVAERAWERIEELL